MRYLKKFNESKVGLIEKRNRIIELVDNYLAYLRSDGMHYNVCYPKFHYTVEKGEERFGACPDLIGTRNFGGVCNADKVDEGYSEIEINLRFRDMDLEWNDISDSIYAFIDVMKEEGFEIVNKEIELMFYKLWIRNGKRVDGVNSNSMKISIGEFLNNNFSMIPDYPYIYQFKLLFDVSN